MKAAVLKTFRDKVTGVVHTPGEVLTLEPTRFSEIKGKLGDSYIAEIADPDAGDAGELKTQTQNKKKANGK